MKLKSTLIAALILISYQLTIAEVPVAGEATDTAVAATPAEDTDSLGVAGYTELEDLVIVQQKKLVQSDGAKLTYNVSEDPESGNSNILEILRKVPGVTVDAEDNVSVNGQSSFKILMNGQENPMLKGDIKTVLKSLPAASIKKIEVISEPGAKYEAEGVGGILNIVTDRTQNLSGFMAQVSGWLNAWQGGGYLNARAKFNKVMVDATLSYNNGHVWNRPYTLSSETEDLTGAPNHLLTTRTKARQGWDYTGVDINMSWEPDTLNLFTLGVNFGDNNWFNRGGEDRSMAGLDMSTIWSMHRDFDLDGHYSGYGVSASYQHNFGREDHNLVASYMYDFWGQHSRTDYSFSDITGTISETPFSRSDERGGNGSHIFQIDYSNRLNVHNLIEGGVKGSINPSREKDKAYFGADPADLVLDETLAINMKQFKDIYALYGSWTGTFDKWNLKAGLRYEHTRMGLKYAVGDHPDFTTHLNDIVPNGAISYNFTTASSLRLAYQMRISRPGLWRLNPYVNVMKPGEISYGNPDLKSEQGHNISIGYSNYEGKFSGSAKLTYRYVDNAINDVIFMKDGILNSTYANTGKEHATFAELNGDWNISSAFRWSLNTWASYYYLCARSELLKAKTCGWRYSVSTNFTYTMPVKVRLSGYAGVYSPWFSLQYKGNTTGYYYGLGCSRSWLKDDALTLQLSVSNLLPLKRTNSSTQKSESVRVHSRQTSQGWNVGLSVSYKFGGLKASMKQTAANVEKESGGTPGSSREAK